MSRWTAALNAKSVNSDSFVKFAVYSQLPHRNLKELELGCDQEKDQLHSVVLYWGGRGRSIENRESRNYRETIQKWTKLWRSQSSNRKNWQWVASTCVSVILLSASQKLLLSVKGKSRARLSAVISRHVMFPFYFGIMKQWGVLPCLHMKWPNCQAVKQYLFFIINNITVDPHFFFYALFFAFLVKLYSFPTQINYLILLDYSIISV